MKKILNLIILMVMVFGVTCIQPATMVHAEKSGIYTYTVSNGTATITDCDTNASGAIAIPSVLDGYLVVSIGSMAFYQCTKLTIVNIRSSVASFGELVF